MAINEEQRAVRLADLVMDIQAAAVDYAEARLNGSVHNQKIRFEWLTKTSFRYVKEIQKVRRAGREGRK